MTELTIEYHTECVLLISRLDPSTHTLPLCMNQVRPGHALPMRECSGTKSTADVQPGKSPPLGPTFWAFQAGPWSLLPTLCEVYYHQQTLPESCPQGHGLKGERGT